MTDFGPYLEFVRIQTEMNKLFESLQDLRDPEAGPNPEGSGWVPNVDVCESAELLLVEAEMPGVDPASLVVRVGGGNMILKGSKPRPAGEPAVASHRRDRALGSFRRVVPLSAPVNTHKAEAVLQGGLLRIRFPKVSNKRGEEILIPVQHEED